ncbi:hypothetical protein DY952_10375 [Pseudomonas aeruginosa]|uniref:hypothetical protein n=1 Tax=Pseudomonas aeruginosa TaxID=287 RepID=UPI000F990AE3|nr:hypothetical protein [Pseudomonas aeruginosa]EKT9494457.1 hypothetical protein [Pseudomonas aeruginosa]MCS8095427.1 hypothetical protein [Pseudomonas aeruginosa]RTS98521.1 hypothetical protein DY952_10375 [Pseudomonas aeruginosa]
MHNIFMGGYFDSMMEGVATETSRKKTQGILARGWYASRLAICPQCFSGAAFKEKIKPIQRLVIQL